MYYTLCIHYVVYSLHRHYLISYFGRNELIWMLTVLLIPLDSILHQFPINLGEKKAGKEITFLILQQ